MFDSIFNTIFFAELPLAVIFVALFFGTFVSEDAACLTAGTLASQGRISFAFAIAACLAGIFVGDILLYGVGRIYGKKILDTKIVSRFVSSDSVKRGSEWLERHGIAAVFTSRFVTGLRLPTYFAAGLFKASFPKFALLFLIAAAIWTPILVGATGLAQSAFFNQNAFIGLIISLILMRFGWKLSSRKNRRLLVGKLKRIYKWEFWPLQFFYVPVVVYIFLLALRHRSLTVFTATNPALPSGGFKGESKNEIYIGLRGSEAARNFLLAHTLLERSTEQNAKVRQARQFISDNELDFPLVLKPNVGERGKDVRIVRTADDLAAALETAKTDVILQEFATGDEISIFYYRFPNHQRGRIFSITEKRFPVVIGDGRSTVEELIFNDPRAVCLAEKYFEQNRDKLAQLPCSGEEVRIIDIGTHSRGAIFLDGGWLQTDALEQTIEGICRGYDGFYFGRFDIRTPSFDDLCRGENFKIIELNGVTSESTNIYDPKYSLFEAYRILFRQWRIAFEIGAANRDRGTAPTPLMELARLALGIGTQRNSLATVRSVKAAKIS